MDETTKDLHRDLARKYKRHGVQVEQMWRSLSQQQRVKIMRDGSRDGAVLKYPEDRSLGNVYKFMPEWNLRDITSPSSDYFLDLLKHRATTSLQEQYAAGVNGGPGDHAHIVDMMQNKNLQLTNASKLKNCFTLFIDEEQYGKSFEITSSNKNQVLAPLRPAIQAQLLVPQAVGDLVLYRQMYLLQSLNIIIEDILETASTTRTQKKRPEKPANVATEALAKLSLHSSSKKLELSDVVDNSLDQKSSLEDYVNLISSEPTVLAYEVNLSFFTRPELVADEKGRMLPVHTDKYISGAVFDAVQGAVKTAAVWNYISRLVTLLQGSSDKQFRAIVLQELFNTCHLEYTRAQTMFKRNVSVLSGGNKWFKRMSNVPKDGIARIAMKRSPDTLLSENPQLFYMLRLCQDETNWSRSAEWLQKLEDLHRAHPLEKEKIEEREFDSLGDLAVIVTFMQSLSSVVQLPTVHRKKGQSFVSGYSSLEKELGQLKAGLDLSEFAIPIDNLLEPGMATGALVKLDEYFVEKTGSKLGFLYQDLVDDCVSNIHKQHEQQKTKASEAKADTMAPMDLEPPELRIEQRRQKEKTRPADSSIYEITHKTATVDSTEEQPTQPQQTFKVKASTFSVFSTLLAKSSAARGSVSWDAFVTAMADLDFSVVPKFGSVYMFTPPEKMGGQKSFALHRPHQSSIEGRHLLRFALRLKRTYGWDASTFVLS